VPRCSTRRSGPSTATQESRGSDKSWQPGLARSAGSPVRAITLGRAWADHTTVVELLVLMALAKSHPPAPGERFDLGLVQGAPAGGFFELPAILLEVRIPTKKFPVEAGRVERPKFLIRARRPPVGAAHRRHLHWQVTDHSVCLEDTREGGDSVRPGLATRVAAAARNRVAASAARRRVAGAGNRSPSSNGLAPGGNPRLGVPDPARVPDRYEGRPGQPHASPPLRHPHRATADMSRGAVRRNSLGRLRSGRRPKQAGQAVAIACVGAPKIDSLAVPLWMPVLKRGRVNDAGLAAAAPHSGA